MKISYLLLGMLTLLPMGTAKAHDYTQGSITIDHPWARPTHGADMGAIYFTLRNSGGEADTLVSVASPVAENTQIHQTSKEGDVMKMREVKDGVTIPPAGKVAFEPGAYHVMLIHLKRQLDQGQRIPVTLTFAKAGAVNVEANVEAQPGDKSAGNDHHGMPGMH